jgi:catalase-peroxidase
MAEVYACDDAQQQFVEDFVAEWDTVMNLDRIAPARA